MIQFKNTIYRVLSLLMAVGALVLSPAVTNAEPAPVPSQNQTAAKAEKENIRKILFIGDSMTGWMAERLNAYGQKNGFEVATIVWDGSTIRKWGSSAALKNRIKEQNPDAVFVSLGLNELFEANPETRLGSSLKSILEAIGNTPYLWIGPPTWPGHKEGDLFNSWMEDKLGEKCYFRSDALQLERQSKSNPHPSRAGIIKWIDEVVRWIPDNTDLEFESLNAPGASEMSRGKVFIYKRMKETL